MISSLKTLLVVHSQGLSILTDLILSVYAYYSPPPPILNKSGGDNLLYQFYFYYFAFLLHLFLCTFLSAFQCST